MAKKVWAWLVPLIVVIIILAIVAIWYGVSKKPTAPTTKEQIRIGTILFLTGNQAVLGEEIKNGLVLANELDNEKAEQKIELVIEDSGDDPNKAISAYNKLRLEKIPIIISSGDQVSYVLSSIANKDKILLLGIAVILKKFLEIIFSGDL
jgi:ABC-type branched-subunit amino acid transport system substrate-binding protein